MNRISLLCGLEVASLNTNFLNYYFLISYNLFISFLVISPRSGVVALYKHGMVKVTVKRTALQPGKAPLIIVTTLRQFVFLVCCIAIINLTLTTLHVLKVNALLLDVALVYSQWIKLQLVYRLCWYIDSRV